MKIYNQTANGKIYKCSKCNKIHLEYHNLYFEFNKKEFAHFANYILLLNGTKWENKNKNSFINRKIIVPINHDNFKITLHNYELLELKNLLSHKTDYKDEMLNEILKNFNNKFTLN